MASDWKTSASMSMPAPAMAHAIRAPMTPVADANRRGRLNTPAPTIEPTTIAASTAKDIFGAGAAGASVICISATRGIAAARES